MVEIRLIYCCYSAEIGWLTKGKNSCPYPHTPLIFFYSDAPVMRKIGYKVPAARFFIVQPLYGTYCANIRCQVPNPTVVATQNCHNTNCHTLENNFFCVRVKYTGCYCPGCVCVRVVSVRVVLLSGLSYCPGCVSVRVVLRPGCVCPGCVCPG